MKALLRRLFLIACIAAIVGASAWQIIVRRQALAAPRDGVMLRIGHLALQPGMPEAFAEVTAAYQRLHPGVRIEQNPVPIRAWPAWMRTQLVGGTAPDIMMLWGGGEELLARYYAPLDSLLEAPNPYNANTPLEGIPWRDTFIDGLASMRSLTPTSGETVGVPLQINTMRLFYNRDLLRTITGSTDLPATYAELQLLGTRVAAYNARHRTNYVPIAGCGPYAQYLFEQLVPSQTQQLVSTLSPSLNLTLTRHEIAAAFLRGELTYRQPEVQSGFRLMRDVGQLLSPGFLSLQRDDAMFAFLQQQTIAIATGSWDYPVLVGNGTFPVSIGRIPLPAPDHPEFGRFVIGPVAESVNSPGASLGALRSGPHVEIARDFLRFITSYGMSSLIVSRSARVSSLRDDHAPRRRLTEIHPARRHFWHPKLKG